MRHVEKHPALNADNISISLSPFILFIMTGIKHHGTS